MKGSLRYILSRVGGYLGKMWILAGAYFLVELLAWFLIMPEISTGILFSAFWALGLASAALLLPRLAGRIFFGVSYFFFVVWTLAQTAYYRIFHKMMWLSDMIYAGEGAGYLGDVLGAFSVFWWIGGLALMGLGVALILKFPRVGFGRKPRIPYTIALIACMAGLAVLPELVFLRDLQIWGARSEYGQSSSYRATYNTMYDAANVYKICGIYQLTVRDIWEHEIYPLTPAYRNTLTEQTNQINHYFARRSTHTSNDMTGIFAGKNVVLVLMESMDDWMITQEDTPTLYQMMNQGIQFTDFYTPGYGTARTINSEFCMNTGIYLPTTGKYVFDYVTNDFRQSLASQVAANGYTAEVFHYNSPSFYSRGILEPAMGYGGYHSYADYVTDEERLYDDCLLFDIPALSGLFFRQGQTFNTIITRSAHLSYTYNEVLSHYALEQYPQYRGKYASQEEDCARVKAKLVDDMFARLVAELRGKDQLKNTVIIGLTDHYTYGYQEKERLYSLSGTRSALLLEKPPCFVWSVDGPAVKVDKTLNTADFLPTILNLLGIDSPYSYLGRDAFDPEYEGYAIFPDGSWICDGVACYVSAGGDIRIDQNSKDKTITKEWLEEMWKETQSFIRISNLLLTSDYYKSVDSAEK